MEEAPAGAVNARAEKLLEAWTSDIGFVIDHLNTAEWFAGKPDLNRVGVFGHSFGGAQAAQFCSQDPRCKAGIDIDGLLVGPVIQTGIHTPFMFLLSDHSHESDPEAGRVMADIQSVYERVPAGERLRVMIRGALHYTFSDDGALLKSRLMRGVLRALGMLSIDGPRHEGEGIPSRDERKKMLQALLAERFQLQFHRESKQAAIFALGVAKNGPIMTERTPGDGGETFGIKLQGLRMIGRSASMADLAFILEKVIPMSDPLRGDHPVVDETGLTGRFDFEVAWIPEKVLSDGGAPQIRKQ